ncbi:Cof-type HAD-IIB family hydrolase [Corynebacterium phoceense]|uniref:HAD hydrolase family protein n=1 Tax=Corynebacterium phoceense TaxID=1686286 RepID=UPI00211BAA9A|nr:HAD family hydrolase [Corynebacterium phoceense]MCQ9330079.1 Cof-type HAD-IIB family hydrolase [Corynebacterium phoceense]MCQ9347236.1 Cof-type HAD-IIB family hydrolase [Corynebacterium phoceense]
MKIAAFDMDGTVYIDHAIAPETVQAIKDWCAAGNLAVSATGKSIDSVRRALEPFGVDMDYHVLYNGTVITDADYQVLYEHHLDAEIVNEVAAHLEGTPGLNLYCTTLDGADGIVTQGIPESSNAFIQCPRVVSRAELEDEKVVLLSAYMPDNQPLQNQIIPWINERYDVSTSLNTGFFDMMPPGHTKGTGLTWLLEHLGLPRAEVELFTFGDSFNDLPMHELAEASFTFPHAHPDVQARAHHVVADVPAGLRLARAGLSASGGD